MDLQNGYDATTHIYHSLYPSIDLPLETLPLSAADFALSLLRSAATTTALDTTTAFIDGFTGHTLSYSEFISSVHSLVSSFLSRNCPTFTPLVKGHVALIVCPPSLHIPILYFALLSLGIIVFPIDPLATESELEKLVQQAKPAIAFTLSSLSDKVASLTYSFSHGIFCLDSSEFESMLTFESQPRFEYPAPVVYQSDIAAMISSSATTGPAKIVEFTHRNIIASLSLFGKFDINDNKNTVQRPMVTLLTTKLELVLGFNVILRNIVTAQSLVILEKYKDLRAIMEMLEKYKVDVLFGYPMLVGAMAAEENVEIVDKFEVTSLKMLISSGMQLHERHFKLFKRKFSHANVMQIFGGATIQLLGNSGPRCYGSLGRLMPHLQAQIVDPSTAQALPPGVQGELWLRGPTIMKGDMCYFDSDGYLYHVDRLKEFINFNSYKVSPSELERVLLLHPEIEDAVVVP
ncbi:hypothetical protein V2J09_017255 [Rumex salicifolius]